PRESPCFWCLSASPAHLRSRWSCFRSCFRYSRGLVGRARAMPHVLTAKARGLPVWRAMLWHILPPVLPGLFSLAVVSLSLALGGSVPVEVICDLPGIGQLAWKAALERDLPVLVTLTLIVSLLSVAANSVADLLIAMVEGPCAVSP